MTCVGPTRRVGPTSPMPRLQSLWQIATVALLGLYCASIFFFALKPLLGWPIPKMLGPASTVLVWAFALLHAGWRLGWRQALVFCGIAFVVGLTLEAIGVATGWVYGGYHYSPRLGPLLFNVPVLIPLSWFMVVYLAYAMTERLAGPWSEARTPSRVLLTCLLGAVVATAWDVVADPQMVKTQLWVWDQPGEFFGVPVHNFAGWLVTAFVVLLLYRVVTWRWAPHPRAAASRLFNQLPVLAYGALALSFVVGYSAQGEGALAVVAFFTMGALALAALANPQSAVHSS